MKIDKSWIWSLPPSINMVVAPNRLKDTYDFFYKRETRGLLNSSNFFFF